MDYEKAAIKLKELEVQTSDDLSWKREKRTGSVLAPDIEDDTRTHSPKRLVTLSQSGAFAIFALTLPLLLVTVTDSSAQKPSKSSGKSRLPQAERITENTFRVGTAIVDTKSRTVTCPGEINLAEGSIEYLAVSPGGKTHESLLQLRIRPLHLQVALLMLDLEPKNVLKRQGDPATPQGDPIEIRIRWKDSSGQTQERPVEEMISDASTGKQMPKHPWVFTGSRILKEGFEADLSKSLIAVYHDPAAIIDNPQPEAVRNAYVVNPKKTPKRGVKIELILKATPRK